MSLRTTPLPGGGNIIEIVGDLFEASNCMGHCVSACLAMGKGIAKPFKENFGCVDQLKAQQVGIGGVAVLPRPQENRFIYYLITKPRYFDKPTYATLRASIRAMVQHMQKNGMPSVSVPELGCGLDRLVFENKSSNGDSVFKVMCEEFSGTGINVTVYHYSGGVNQTAAPTIPQQGGGGGAAAAAAASSTSGSQQAGASKAASPSIQQQMLAAAEKQESQRRDGEGDKK